MKTPVYMDYHATTPVDPEVLAAMLPYFSEQFGNPASRQHRFGWITEEAVESARKSIAGFIGADSREIIFTSGATESNNLAIKGVAESLKQKGDHIITVSTEHKSVLDSCHRLEKYGFHVTYLSVDEFGMIDLNQFREQITPKTILVSVMIANNEIGTIQDVVSIGSICKERGVLFHTDASQAIGKIPIHVGTMHIDLMSFTGHKIYDSKRHRGFVCSTIGSTRKTYRSNGWRRARAGNAFRDVECSVDRRFCKSIGNRPQRHAGRIEKNFRIAGYDVQRFSFTAWRCRIERASEESSPE